MKRIMSVIVALSLAITLLSPVYAVATRSQVEEESPVWSYSGKGDDVVTGFKSDGYYYVLKVYHNSKGHFAIKGYYGEKSYDYDLLINTTDPYIDGTTLLKPNREYTFEITAKGDWKMDIYSLGISDADSITAKGDYVSGIFTSSAKAYQITTKGKGHLSIKGIYGMRDFDYELLVNTTDADYNGKVFFNHKGDRCFFVIDSEREVSITPVE